MLVREERNALRLIRQNDHALASGVLAHTWIGFGSAPGRFPFTAVLGVALHDLAWADADAKPKWNPDTRGPYSFVDYPLEERIAFYSRGLDRVEMIDRYAGLLGSLHYSRFYPEVEAFSVRETARQKRLQQELGIADDDDCLQRHSAFLRLFDDLSLFACLTGPTALDPPEWLAPERVGCTPDGESFSLTWINDSTISLSPFPFAEHIELTIPARSLPRQGYSDESALLAAWQATPVSFHRVSWTTSSPHDGKRGAVY